MDIAPMPYKAFAIFLLLCWCLSAGFDRVDEFGFHHAGHYVFSETVGPADDPVDSAEPVAAPGISLFDQLPLRNVPRNSHSLQKSFKLHKLYRVYQI
jgi:hypothetical protein